MVREYKLIVSILITLNFSGAALAEFDRRIFNPTIDEEWIGNGISYGAYRDGQAPGDLTSKADILEDLRILAPRWRLIRLYGSGQQSRNILEVIRDHELPVRVMQGAWISAHQSKAENREQIDGAVAGLEGIHPTFTDGVDEIVEEVLRGDTVSCTVLRDSVVHLDNGAF